MAKKNNFIKIYFEIGKKRTFACALEWLGWSRSGPNEDTARQALLEAGPRYALIMQQTDLSFTAPKNVETFQVVERLPGTTTTDFGAPEAVPAYDREPLNEGELLRLQTLLKACWASMDAAVEAARGKELRKGPRGGGRDLDKLVEHVLGAERGYLSRLGGILPKTGEVVPSEQASLIRQASMEALAVSMLGEIPERGPRGGKRWTARTFVRRAAWHILDHVWEIEDRIL